MPLIVIVDNRITNRNIFAKLAASIASNIQTKTFSDPEPALDWMVDHGVDLVVTDYKMPTMNGAEFVRAIREMPHNAHTPVIVITVNEERSSRLRALEAGATDFLTSPVDHHEFVTRTRNLLTLQSQQHLLAQRADELARTLASTELRFAKTIRDLTSQFKAMIDSLPFIMSGVDRAGDILFVNAAFCEFLKKNPLFVVGKSLSSLLGEPYAGLHQKLNISIFESGGTPLSYKETITSAKGNASCFLTFKTPLLDPENNINGVMTCSFDINSIKGQKRYFDAADLPCSTNEPDREPEESAILEKLRVSGEKARRERNAMALFIFSFDGVFQKDGSRQDVLFKRHKTALLQLMNENDWLIQLAAGAFAFLRSNISDKEEVGDFAARIAQIIAAIGDQSNPPVLTMGAALYPQHVDSAEELLRIATLAFEQSKQCGGNGYCLFEPVEAKQKNGVVERPDSLCAPVDYEQRKVHCQAQKNIAAGAIPGDEALLLWHKSGAGLIDAGLFLALIEDSELIFSHRERTLGEKTLGERTLETVWADALLWENAR